MLYINIPYHMLWQRLLSRAAVSLLVKGFKPPISLITQNIKT